MTVMLRRALTTFAAAAFGMLIVASARAADLPPAPVIGDYAPDRVVELGTGWYLRGDVGLTKYQDLKGEARTSGFGVGVLNPKVDQTYSAGGGVGYKFTNWLRTDVTVDYRFPADYNAVSSFGGGVSSTDRTRLGGIVGLANGYVDLGNWSGITPYVGAGIGLAYNQSEDYLMTPTVGGLVIPTYALQRQNTYSFAWALMGGLAIDLGQGFSIDVGYRYLRTQEAKLVDDGINLIRLKDVGAQEIRVGFRYVID